MTSRLDRIEQNKAKKRIALIILASISLLGALFILGVPILVRMSVFFGDKKSLPVKQLDTTAPFAPVIETTPEATNSATITIKGYSEAETSIRLFINNKEISKIKTENDGSFVLKNVNLKKGTNTINLTAIDSSNNESAPTIATVFFSTESPSLEISEPPDKQIINGKENSITILGITDAGTSVHINDRFVTVSTDGSFRFPFRLENGENKIVITATNSSGNVKTIERRVTYNAE